MKLLIVTQAVDRRDPVMGFFHRWIEEFASHCDHVTVITQRVGEHRFPRNVVVRSLGKESGASRVSQVLLFLRLIFTESHSYDAALVHMTPVWMVIGGFPWMLLRKRRYLWYEVKRGSRMLDCAVMFSNRVFSATKHGLPRPHRKQVVTGHGIDLQTFTPDLLAMEPGHIVAVGRLTQVKRYDLLLQVLRELPACRLTIAGGTVTGADKSEETMLRSLMKEYGVEDRVTIGWVDHSELPTLLRSAALMLHAGEGGLDKAALEAMACGCPVVSCSVSAQEILPSACRATEETLIERTKGILALTPAERQQLSKDLRERIERDHSLPHLIAKLTTLMT